MTKMTKAQLVDENIRLRIECDRLESQLGSANAIIKDLDEQIRRKDIALGRQPAPQPGAAYAALPEYGINTASHAHFRVLGFTADQMRAFADATHALRASHGQASDDLLKVALAYKDYIDALPSDVVATLPAMPGIDGDWAAGVLDRAARAPADSQHPSRATR